MHRESVVFGIGIVLLIVPQLGIPSDWKRWCIFVSAVMLIWIGYSLRRSAYLRSIENATGERHSESFVESTPKELARTYESR